MSNEVFSGPDSLSGRSSNHESGKDEEEGAAVEKFVKPLSLEDFSIAASASLEDEFSREMQFSGSGSVWVNCCMHRSHYTCNCWGVSDVARVNSLLQEFNFKSQKSMVSIV